MHSQREREVFGEKANGSVLDDEFETVRETYQWKFTQGRLDMKATGLVNPQWQSGGLCSGPPPCRVCAQKAEGRLQH